jgi:hypothetical protein
MSYTAISLIGFVALLGIVAYFLFFRQGSNTGVPSESTLLQTERSNTYDTSRSSHPEQEPFNYTRASTNYAYYSGS